MRFRTSSLNFHLGLLPRKLFLLPGQVYNHLLIAEYHDFYVFDLVFGPGARAAKPREDDRSHTKAKSKKAAIEWETQTLELALIWVKNHQP